MDPNPEGSQEIDLKKKKKKKKSLCYHLLVLLFTFIFFISIFLSIFFAGFLPLLIDKFSIPTPISLPSHCKIISSGVDLRSSKVCELGVLNYKAKNVFDPYDRTKFRCRYDYYWASIFKVEYKEHTSGQTRNALVESPKEALPINCRPSFGTAWLTKDKLKVNGTYNCWYTPGTYNVDIFPDSVFNCQAKDPSLVEMIQRYYILWKRMTGSLLFSTKRIPKRAILETVVGLITGMSTSLISIILVKVLQISRLNRIWDLRNLSLLRVVGVYMKRVCFLVVYFSVVGWLTIQYGKMLGLPNIIFGA